jgi:hypothetical protein
LNGNHLSDAEMTFSFETQGILVKVLQELHSAFNENIIHTHVKKSVICDGCGDILVRGNLKKEIGTFFCKSCKRNYHPGVFKEKALLCEIQLCDQDHDLWKKSTNPYWKYYIKKIKRSCRYHHVDFPEWIGLGED